MSMKSRKGRPYRKLLIGYMSIFILLGLVKLFQAIISDGFLNIELIDVGLLLMSLGMLFFFLLFANNTVQISFNNELIQICKGDQLETLPLIEIRSVEVENDQFFTFGMRYSLRERIRVEFFKPTKFGIVVHCECDGTGLWKEDRASFAQTLKANWLKERWRKGLIKSRKKRRR